VLLLSQNSKCNWRIEQTKLQYCQVNISELGKNRFSLGNVAYAALAPLFSRENLQALLSRPRECPCRGPHSRGLESRWRYPRCIRSAAACIGKVSCGNNTIIQTEEILYKTRRHLLMTQWVYFLSSNSFFSIHQLFIELKCIYLI
jgi:hypothetical protein